MARTTVEPETEFGAQLCVSLDLAAGAMNRNASAIESEAQFRQAKSEALRQIPIAPPQIPLTGGAGILDLPDILSARAGYVWSVRRLAVTGFTAGTVTVSLNASGGEPVAIFSSAQVVVYPRGGIVMHPNDRLVFTATGVTGFVQVNGSADCMEAWLFPFYLSDS